MRRSAPSPGFPGRRRSAARSAAARVLGIAPYGIDIGGRADFVAVDASSLAEAVATRPRRKLVIKAGRIVAQDGVLIP